MKLMFVAVLAVLMLSGCTTFQTSYDTAVGSVQTFASEKTAEVKSFDLRICKIDDERPSCEVKITSGPAYQGAGGDAAASGESGDAGAAGTGGGSTGGNGDSGCSR